MCGTCCVPNPAIPTRSLFQGTRIPQASTDDFLKGASLTGMVAAGNAANAEITNAACNDISAGLRRAAGIPAVAMKLVYYAMIHSSFWEGPCRYSEMSLGPDAEKGRRGRGMRRR